MTAIHIPPHQREARYIVHVVVPSGRDKRVFTHEDREWLQEIIDAEDLDYVRTTDGEILHIHTKLNAKSIPLNDASDTKTRIPYDKVVSFGRLQEADQEVQEGHADRDHALLSASGANRWLNCTPSAQIETRYPDTSSDAADQGTAAHELAEHKLRALLDEPTTRPESDWQDEEMEDHTDAYADHVMAELAQAKDTNPAAFCSIEERLDFSHIVPDGFGTGDAIIVGDGTMTIVDLKYGKGVEVNAENNPQMSLYALGALRTYGMIYNIQTVRMVIFQPRLNNVSVWETTPDKLTEWAETVVKPTAEIAAKGGGDLTPGDWCRFCKHSAQCPAMRAQYFDMIPTEGDVPTSPAPDTLTEEQIAMIVAHSGELKKWLGKVEKYALDQANAGHKYPGLKLVEGRSDRKYGDEAAIARAVEEAGVDPWQHKLLGITALTKLLGKKRFDELVGDYLVKPEGKPTLVPMSDKRPELVTATAENVFIPIAQETA